MSNQKRLFKLKNRTKSTKDETNNIIKDEQYSNKRYYEKSGITISPHEFWPDLPQIQRCN